MTNDSETRSLLNDDTDASENACGTETGHCHSLLLQQNDEKQAERALRIITFLSAIFIITELAGGIFAGSLAIMADAGHMLSDFFSFVVSLLAIRVSRHSANRRVTFGFARAEVLGALFSVFVIWTLTIMLIVFATQRLRETQIDIEPDIMLVTALLGVAFNIVMAGILFICGGIRGHCHANTPRHCPNSGNASTSNTLSHNVNVRAAFIHILGDFVQSIGVLCAALVIKLTGWTLADPLCTYLFSIIVLATSLPVLRDICYILMEAAPTHIDYELVLKDLKKIRCVDIAFNDQRETIEQYQYADCGDICQSDSSTKPVVKAVHSFHMWALNTRHLCASVHLIIDKRFASTTDAISRQATHLLQYKYGIAHTTIQIEIGLEDIINCHFCEPFV